jgi:cyclophilin family peptidyl-prolyl cis-trans isomerase/HEAT repeat protein
MIAWLLSSAWAGADDPTLDRIAALEWDRQPAVQLQAQVAGGDADTRVTAVRALGRLRSADALAVLLAWRDDPEPGVREAVAQSLGWTPGGAEALRAWWMRADDEPAEVRAAILVGLGRTGDVRDVQALLAATAERGAPGVAAARAVGLLGARQISGIEIAVPVLAARLDPREPAKAEAIAWALARMRKPVPPEHVPALLATVDAGPSPEVRAWLLKAAWGTMDPEDRADRFLWAMTDAPRLVQVTVLNALLPEDAEPAVLAGFLLDADPWIRAAAIDAIGRHGSEEAAEVLDQHLAHATDPWEQAQVVRALRRPDPGAAGDASLPVVVRAAWVEGLDDPEALVRYATEAPEPVIRSAAAGAWMERDPRAVEVQRLLAASDPLVRQVAADRAGALPPREGAPLLATALATEGEPAVRAQAWRSLEALVTADPRALPARDPRAKAAVAALGTADAATIERARALAKRLLLPPPAATVTPRPERFAVPVGDDVVAVPSRPSDLAEIRRIRSARVTTDEGEFVIALDPARAPLAVATFASLAEGGFFDGLPFHRVVPGFVAQTGCPRGDGWGGPGFTLPDEDSELPFDVGAVGMARDADRDTAGSQWFVVTADQPHLTSEYTRFGQVVHGLHVAQHLRAGSVVLGVVVERVP